MPSYNFKQRFAALVESGVKSQTIRATNRNARRGQSAYLYTGMRTKSCRRLGVGTLANVMPIEIGRHACGEPYAVLYPPEFIVHGDLDNFARADGFETSEEMVSFFESEYGLPFKGFLHTWELS